MRECYKFGIMLERIDIEPGLAYVKNPRCEEWQAVDCYWRVFSGRLHGPLMFTPTSAFFAWLKNWITDCVRTKRRHTPD